MTDPLRYCETIYGFDYGAAEVTRVCRDPKWGSVIQINTPRQCIHIRVTPSGLIRVSEVMEPIKND